MRRKLENLTAVVLLVATLVIGVVGYVRGRLHA